MTPASELIIAISSAVQAGAKVPCLGPSREWWTADEQEQLEGACMACSTCPVLALCADYRADHRETGAVFAGVMPDSPHGRRATKEKKS